MKINYDWKVIKNDNKDLTKNTPKKNILKNQIKIHRKKKYIYFLKKVCQKKSSKKVLKRKKNKPYIVTHWHASLNITIAYRRNFQEFKSFQIGLVFDEHSFLRH